MPPWAYPVIAAVLILGLIFIGICVCIAAGHADEDMGIKERRR
jgi:hypothetical protein